MITTEERKKVKMVTTPLKWVSIFLHKIRNKDTLKELDEWWLIDMADIVQALPDPRVVKVTSKRCNYVWEDF